MDEKGELSLKKPLTYQRCAGSRAEIAGKYFLLGKREVGFELEEYDASLPLVSDPVLSYSTYLGGSSNEDAYAIAVDSYGNAYIAGGTPSTNFPTAIHFAYNAYYRKLNDGIRAWGTAAGLEA